MASRTVRRARAGTPLSLEWPSCGGDRLRRGCGRGARAELGPVGTLKWRRATGGCVLGGSGTIAPTRSRDLDPWQVVVAPFLASRLFSDVLVGGMALMRGRNGLRGGFAHWDGRWYSWIAAHGYAAMPHAHRHQTPWPFFPVLPAAMRGIGVFGLSMPVAGIVLNHVAFFVGLLGIYRIAVRHVSSRGAVIAVWVASVSPFAFVFSMVYPSAIFLAASVWAFLLVEEGNDLAAGLAAAVAALARPDGFILVMVLLAAVRLDWSRALRVAGPAVVGLSGWMLFNLERTGDALRFLHAKRAWHEVDLLAFLQHPTANAAFHVAVAGIAVAIVFGARRAIPRSWPWFTVLYLVPSLVLGVVGMGRYATDTFPPVVSAGVLLQGHRRRTVVATLAALAILQAVCAYFYIANSKLL
jgi:hypothetical protein